MVKPEMLYCSDSFQPLGLVIIGNGSVRMAAKYRQIWGNRWQVYTDPEGRVYEALGMGKMRDIPIQAPSLIMAEEERQENEKRQENVEDEMTKKGPVKKRLVTGITMVVLRALKVGMPVWEKGGDVQQLGGEFVFGPG
jgi:hypothetical protein